MSYTADSPIMGQGQASAAAIAAWLRGHNPQAPASEIGSAVVNFATPYGVNSDLVAGQIMHETGWWTSGWAKRNNPAGLGVTGEPGKGLDFPTPSAGIRAQVAHLLTYTVGESNPLKSVDPRYQAAADEGYLGIAHVLRDLEQRWAVSPADEYAATPPDQRYGARVAALANELVAFAAGEPNKEQPVSGAEWPTANELGVPCTIEPADADIGPERAIAAVKWFVVHDTEGHRASDLQILEHADPAQASVHFWISLAGEVVCIVPITQTSWTVANQAVDVQAINVELEGFEKDQRTEAQYVSCAAVFRWCRSKGMTVPAEYVGKDERPGIIGHQDVADPYKPGQWGGADNHTDPGPLFRWQHLVELINGAPATATPSTERIINGHTLAGGFRAFYEDLEHRLGANDALMLIGYPLTDERQEDGLTVQWFERARFEWRKGQRSDRWDVLLSRLGAEALAAKTATPS